MRAAALRVELRIPGVRSLKGKRSALRPVIEGLRRVGSLSVAEVGRQDSWQRATIGIAMVASDGKSMAEHVSRIRRYLDARHEIEVLDVAISELEDPE